MILFVFHVKIPLCFSISYSINAQSGYSIFLLAVVFFIFKFYVIKIYDLNPVSAFFSYMQ